MKEKDVYAEISSIKNLMERSSKFISLSGLSGVMAGIYGLCGAFMAGHIIKQHYIGELYATRNSHVHRYGKQLVEGEIILLTKLCLLAMIVLSLSLITALILTVRKAKQKQQTVWNPVSRKMLVSAGIPLVTGGLLILIMIWHGAYIIVAPACLVFYGLALIAGSQYTYHDIKWLGLCEIALGLVAALCTGSGLICWTIGFGVLHIIYGAVMYFKYDR